MSWKAGDVASGGNPQKARGRMNREQRRRAEKVLAAKLGGKKKLQQMLAEARARARAADEERRNKAAEAKRKERLLAVAEVAEVSGIGAALEVTPATELEK